MSRIPYLTPETANSEQQAHLQNLQNTRGRVSNIFLALANVPSLGEGVLAMATSLRKSTLLSRRLRELAVVTVGIETNAYYELAHHWKVALDLGISQGELEAITKFDKTTIFNAQERAVIAFALELTRTGSASIDTWNALAPMEKDARLELVLTVSWYNCVARIAQGLDLDMEDWFTAPTIPPLTFVR